MPFTATARTSSPLPARALHCSCEAGALTLSFDGLENYSFDGEGRLVGAWREQITYRRGLDNRILAKWIEAEGAHRRGRRLLDQDERRVLLESVYARAADAAEALRTGTLSVEEKDGLEMERALEWLARLPQWTWPRLETEAHRFAAVYKPVPILPPDQYLSLVIQATEGCSYNECTFCTFYRDRPFRIKTPAALAEHTQAALAFLGRGASLRRSVFLADANAVIVAQSRLLPMLESLNTMLPIEPHDLSSHAAAEWKAAHPWRLDGFYAFVSAPDALRKSAGDFAELRARNLRRVYVGLESAHDPLRAFLRKPGRAADVAEAVRTIKQGGLALGLIVMVGIGGERFREQHFAATRDFIESLGLGAGDLIYLSPFVSSGGPYDDDLVAAGIRPLAPEELLAEEERQRAALLPTAKRTGARVSHYDIREFIY